MEAIYIPFDKSKSIQVEDGYVIDNYLAKTNGMGHSLVCSHLDGKHPMMKNISSDRTYFLTSGSAVFYVNGKTQKVNANEVISIPKNTLFSFEGKFDAVLVCVPAFDPNDDVIYHGVFAKSEE